MTAHARPAEPDRSAVDWGEYAAAVHRWETITGRRAPYPTQPGRHGRPVLAPIFVEWLMGLPPGWVTAEHLDLPRTGQLRVLGNGVMPQQAAHALAQLLDDLTELGHHLDFTTPRQPQRPSARQAPSARPARRAPTGTSRRQRPAATRPPSAARRPRARTQGPADSRTR
ncbi:hypothetical protein [Amycolatopsis sp. cmx-11-32]|uniref:hypothetical protein n=1 Tax=Amycolatopsis sp. cmx-11-32 TaxID=2785796 RepID=UPI0039E375B2